MTTATTSTTWDQAEDEIDLVARTSSNWTRRSVRLLRSRIAKRNEAFNRTGEAMNTNDRITEEERTHIEWVRWVMKRHAGERNAWPWRDAEDQGSGVLATVEEEFEYWMALAGWTLGYRT